MTAQVYEKQRINYLTTFIPDQPPYTFNFLIGEFAPWGELKNTNNEFISLGGSKENPLTYKFQDTGITDFTFNIAAPAYPLVTEVYSARAYFELWLTGNKTYYYYFGEQSTNIFNRTVSVMGTKNQTTNFRFALTLLFMAPTPELKKFYFEGSDNDTVYSSITAKFISDSIPTPVSLPIIHLLSPQQLPTNTICVFTAGDYSYPLPTTSAVNDIIELKIQGASSYTITQAEGQKVSIGDGSTTTGTTGSFTCRENGGWVRLICTIANKEWMELGVSGDSFELK